MRQTQGQHNHGAWVATAIVAIPMVVVGLPFAKALGGNPSSYSPVVIQEDFETTMARMKAAKPEVMKRQMDLLAERYDLSDRPGEGVAMSRGKAVQAGVRVKLPTGMTWDKLSEMSPTMGPAQPTSRSR